jgi:hypothetical protein
MFALCYNILDPISKGGIILSINEVAKEISKVVNDFEVDKLSIKYIVEYIKKEKTS